MADRRTSSPCTTETRTDEDVDRRDIYVCERHKNLKTDEFGCRPKARVVMYLAQIRSNRISREGRYIVQGIQSIITMLKIV